MMTKSTLEWVALILVVVGGINWGLVGIMNLDLVEAILGSIPMVQKIVYILVGVAALYMGYSQMKQ